MSRIVFPSILHPPSGRRSSVVIGPLVRGILPGTDTVRRVERNVGSPTDRCGQRNGWPETIVNDQGFE